MSGDLKKLEDAARKFVNERRKSIGLRATSRLSKGYPLSTRLCCLAMSLECCGVYEVLPDPDSGVIELRNKQGKALTFKAPEVAEFAKQFDLGKYHHLEIPSTPIRQKQGRKLAVIEPAKYLDGTSA